MIYLKLYLKKFKRHARICVYDAHVQHPLQHNVPAANNTMWSPPHFPMYGSPPQWASAQWGSPNGGGFPLGMGYPMGGMMGMGPMGYPMMPWANAYRMGERPGSGQPYPSTATPNIRSSSNFAAFTPTPSSVSYSPTSTLAASSSAARGQKRPNDDDDDDKWTRPVKRLVTQTVDLDDVFAGPVRLEAESEYIIAPPPPASARFTAISDPVISQETCDTTLVDSAAKPPFVDPAIGQTPAYFTVSSPATGSIAPPTHSTSCSPTSILLSTQTAVISSTHTPVTSPTVSPAKLPAVSSPLIVSPTVVVPTITAAQSLNNLYISLIPALRDLMETLRWGCPTHYILGIDEPMEHRATTCPLGKCNNSDEGWKNWRKGLHFANGCCYGCGVERERTFTDELGETQHLIHAEPVGARCLYSETLRAMAWVIYSTPVLRAAYEKSVWRNMRGLDSIPAVPFVRWLGLADSPFGLNLYTVGFFALTLRGQPRASTTFPMF